MLNDVHKLVQIWERQKLANNPGTMSEIQPYGDEPEEVWDDEEDDDAVDSLLLGGNAENETLDKEVSTYAELLYHNLIVSLLSSNPKKEVVSH